MTPSNIQAAGRCLARAWEVLYGVDGTSVEDAARAAWTPTGPPLAELEARIRARREQALAEQGQS